LGPQTPLDQLHAAAEHEQAGLIWLSVSVCGDGKAFSQELSAFCASQQSCGRRIVFGGRAFDASLCGCAADVCVGRSMNDLVRFSNGQAESSPMDPTDLIGL
ncbi:MAG: hypothetical protein V3T70_05425, partial [Phycisphaerae bacterium]